MGILSETEQFAFPIFKGDHFLTEPERSKLIVLFDALFPPDHSEGQPGASDAKAQEFVSYLLALDEKTFHKIPQWRVDYRDGIAALDAAAGVLFGKEIQDLGQNEATTFLTELEDGTLKGLPDKFDQNGFFRTLLEHCIKGCFSDPRWGGNKAGTMWRWLGWVQPAEEISFEATDQ